VHFREGIRSGESRTGAAARHRRRATGLGVDAAELYALFATPVDPDTTARLRLGLSVDDVAAIADVRDGAVRFVRLARKTGLAFPDLDLLLRSCCGGTLDRAALRTVAALLAIGRGADLPIDVACSLVAPLDTAGLDGTGTTSTPFDRTDTSADLSLLHRVSRLVTPERPHGLPRAGTFAPTGPGGGSVRRLP